jgi:hypothetical protein
VGSISSRLVLVTLSASALVLVAFALELVTFLNEVPVQRGIDANTARVTARYTEFVPENGMFQAEIHVVSFNHAGRPVRVPMRSLPGGTRLGDDVCLEVDATRPENARVCGTRGNLGDSRQGLIFGGSLLAVALGAGGLLAWFGRRGAAAGSDANVDRPDIPTIRRGQNVVLRPAAVTRVGTVAFLVGVPGTIAGGLVVDRGGGWPWLAAVVGLSGIVAIRLWRARIRCSDGVVSVIRPFRRTGRIPASAVTAVLDLDYPVIDWRQPSGERGTVTAFGFWMGRGVLASVRRHHLVQVATLRAWVAAHREPGTA